MRARRHITIVLALLFATRTASGQTFTLKGTIVAPADAPATDRVKVIADGQVTVSGSTIGSVGAAGPQTPAQAIDVDGVIFPGLIDLHDHITWNLFPRWKPARLFANRYEWQDTAEYVEVLSGPKADLDARGYGCDMNRYGELKAIVNGATASIGGATPNVAGATLDCIRGLARNLDSLSELPGATPGREPFRNLIFPLQPSTPCEEQAVRDLGAPIKDCSPEWNVAPMPPRPAPPKPSPLRAVVAHVAEGVDASAKREFTMLEAHGFLRKGLSIIHGVALQAEHFKKMRDAEVGLIWSPRSNLELYGRTVDIAAAKAAGVKLAIAPDWSPTGSSGMLAELAYAERLRLSGTLRRVVTEQDLVEMATVNPADLAGLGHVIGKLASGYAADLVVMRKRPAEPGIDESTRAFQALLKQSPGDLLLVVVGGTPVYGEPALMKRLLPTQPLESLTICGETRAINVATGPHQSMPWAVTEARLRAALGAYRIPLAPLAECSIP